MRPRYLITIATGERREGQGSTEVAGRLGLERVCSTGCFTIFCDDIRTVVDLGAAGAVIGPIYRTGDPAPIDRFDQGELAHILSTRGRRLASHYWGEYVAVLSIGASITVVRDPSGALGCCYGPADDVCAVASDPDLVFRSGMVAKQIDFSAIGRNLFTAGLPSTATAFSGLIELLPGSALCIRAGLDETVPYWSPWDHVQYDPDASAEATSSRIARTIRSTTASLAHPFGGILVGISGGLDSSIVTAALSGAEAKPSCTTVSTSGTDGDERRYARILCDSLALPLFETSYQLSDIDVSRAASPELLRPTSRTQSLSYDSAIRRHVQERGFDAFFTGNGGDNVFAYSHSAAALYDRYLSDGFGRGVVQTLVDICRLTGCSLPQAIGSARRVASAPTTSYHWPVQDLFLDRDFVASERVRRIAHPWLEAPAAALPGKAVHIALLLRIQQHLHASEHAIGVPMISPLMAQPVIEACLSIPSWRWCTGGVDRAVARQAFRDALPLAITGRSTKGGPDSFCIEIIEAHRAEIRRRLHEGRMARHGLLDLKEIDRVLSTERPDMAIEQVRLLTLIECEAWIDAWID